MQLITPFTRNTDCTVVYYSGKPVAVLMQHTCSCAHSVCAPLSHKLWLTTLCKWHVGFKALNRTRDTDANQGRLSTGIFFLDCWGKGYYTFCSLV